MDYRKAVETAHAAVKSVRSLYLKQIAFEAVLQKILSDEPEEKPKEIKGFVSTAPRQRR